MPLLTKEKLEEKIGAKMRTEKKAKINVLNGLHFADACKGI